jgi:hypothetical protein
VLIVLLDIVDLDSIVPATGCEDVDGHQPAIE